MDRVIKRLPEIKDTYVDEPIRYFYGVARYVIREAFRRKEVAFDVLPECLPLRRSDGSALAECLRRCLRSLPGEEYELIHDYHIFEGRQKIESHREMAAELSITVGALRTRAHHIRSELHECVEKCLDSTGTKRAPGIISSSGPLKERQS